MTHHEDDKATLAALRTAPTEVSLEQVRSMVATFPLAVGAMAWLISAIKFNLNTMLMTSSAVLIVGTSAFLAASSVPAELPAAAANTPAVVLELPVAEALPEPEPAVVFEQPAPKKATRPPSRKEQPTMACMVVGEDVQQEPLEQPDEEPVHAYTGTQPLPSASTVVQKTNGARTFQLRDFTGIKVVSSMDVTLEIGDFEVTATGEEDVLDKLDVQVKERVLELDFAIIGRSRRTCGPVHFTVRMPLVHALTVMGSGSVHGPEIPPTANLDLNVMGSGSITLKKLLDATTLSMLVKGSGGINLQDVVRTEQAQVSVMGSGVADVSRIGSAGDLHVVIAGSGIANCRQVNVTGTTALNITGSGQVTTTGRTDRIEVTLIGSGDVMAKELKAQGGKVTVTGSGDASVYSDGPLELLTTGSGTIHTSGSAGRSRSRGVEDDGR